MAAATGDGVCVRIEASPAGSGYGDGGVLSLTSLHSVGEIHCRLRVKPSRSIRGSAGSRARAE
jgi:hypothetical protein